MIPEQAHPWQQSGARATTRAQRPDLFIDQHVSPLFFRRTKDGEGERMPNCEDIVSEEQFWGKDGDVLFSAVRLNGFRLTDWFPRAPSVYWSRHARQAREYVYSEEPHSDPGLGRYYSPQSKMALIEEGGIGTIRLRSRRIDGEVCWLGTALSRSQCHSGIPLAIPDAAIRCAGVYWGDRVNIQGRVRFLQDAGLDETAARVHHARPLIVFVDKLEGIVSRPLPEPIVISPVALFESRSDREYDRAHYTFVQCGSGSDAELDIAVECIERYTTVSVRGNHLFG